MVNVVSGLSKALLQEVGDDILRQCRVSESYMYRTKHVPHATCTVHYMFHTQHVPHHTQHVLYMYRMLFTTLPGCMSVCVYLHVCNIKNQTVNSLFRFP